jgi:hypothetical protein
MSTPAQPPETVSKVWVVLLLDGNGGVAYLTAFTYDSDMAAINQWAEAKIAADKATFTKNPENASLAQRFVVYGSEVDRLHITKPERIARVRT